MKTASPRYALIFATCCSLIWSTPVNARFLQVDPIGYDDQVNLYAYVGNDPLNATDPSGEDRVACNISLERSGSYSGTCTVTRDESSTTTVTYRVTQHSTDAYGRDQTRTQSIQRVYQGSISQEGVMSRIFYGAGQQILSSIERSVSNIVGAEVHPFTAPADQRQPAATDRGGVPTGWQVRAEGHSPMSRKIGRSMTQLAQKD